MTAALAPFNFEGSTVRAGLTDAGEPWFVAADIARVLGHASAKDMTRSLDDDEKGGRLMPTPGGEQVVSVITESGLYSAILSRQTGRIEDPAVREAVARFKRWVTHEVLPAIRRTGAYGVPTLPDITTAAGVLAMAEQFAETARALVASQEKVAELEPKADLADTFLIADKSQRLVREAAKLLGMKERALRVFLISENLLYVKHARCGDVQYDFYAAHAHHFVAKEKVIEHSWGTCSHYTIFVTARGIELIRKRMAAPRPALSVAR